MISTEVNLEMAKVDIELAASPYVSVHDYGLLILTLL